MSTGDVAVVIHTVHLRVSSRGIIDINSSTNMAEYGSAFLGAATKDEFLKYIA